MRIYTLHIHMQKTELSWNLLVSAVAFTSAAFLCDKYNFQLFLLLMLLRCRPLDTLLVCFSGLLAKHFLKQIVVALDNIPRVCALLPSWQRRRPSVTHCASVPLCNVLCAHICIHKLCI